ncbi:MAG: zinc ribbon domain-containing protein [Clostridiales bacterium]|nr:zinc ribbon domain-containing protein [Clostridiales bacterium]
MNETVFCAQCGTQMSGGTAFCPNCGTKQNVKAETPVSNVAPTPTVSAIPTPTTGAIPTPTVSEIPTPKVTNNGQPQAQPTQPQAPAYIPTPVPVGTVGTTGGIKADTIKKYIPIICIALAVIVAIIVGISILVNSLKYTKIDAQELCRVTFSGVDGDGVAEAGFAYDPLTSICYDSYMKYMNEDDKEAKVDMDELVEFFKSELDGKAYEEFEEEIEKYKESIDDNSEIEKYIDLKYSKYLSYDSSVVKKAFSKADSKKDAEKMRKTILKNVEFDIISDSKGLKVGDTVEIEVIFDKDELKDENIKLKNTKFKVKVKGLLDGETVDIFKDLTIDFTGVDGCGSGEINTSACSDFVKNNVKFYIYYNYDLSNDDIVSVEFYLNDDVKYDFTLGGVVVDDYLYVFDHTSDKKDFTATGLGEVKKVSPFDYVEIKYSGTYPGDVDIDAVFKDGTPEAIVDNVQLYVEGDYNIKDGDTFKVTTYVYSVLDDKGYILTEYEKEYTFDSSKVSAYVTDKNLFKNDTYKDIMDTVTKEDLDEEVGKTPTGIDVGTIDSITSIEQKTSYFLVNPDQNSYSAKNYFMKIYEVKAKCTKDGASSDQTFYVGAEVSNVLANGTTLVDIEKDDVDTEFIPSFEDFPQQLTTLGYTINEIK